GVKYVLLPLTYTAYEADLKSRGFKEVYQSLETRVMENMDVLPRAFAISTDGLAEKNNPALPADYAKHVVPVSIDSYHNARVKLSGST
ncbi:hypothetical protein N3553_25365, partial [Pantoea dispersa]